MEKKKKENIIVSSSKIKGGRPCIEGTRTEVQDILGVLSEGVSEKDIIQNCREAKTPISQEEISAALKYAAKEIK